MWELVEVGGVRRTVALGLVGRRHVLGIQAQCISRAEQRAMDTRKVLLQYGKQGICDMRPAAG